MIKDPDKSGQRRHGAPRSASGPIRHPSLSGRAILHPLPAEHPAAGMLPSVVELAAVILQTARADPAAGPALLREAVHAELPAIAALITAESGFVHIVAHPECHGTGKDGLATAPALMGFSRTVRDLGILLSTSAVAEAAARDHAVRELVAGRARVTPEGAIVATGARRSARTPAADKAVLHPLPPDHGAAGMLAIVVRLAAIVARALAKPPAPGWLPMRAAMQRDFPLLRAVMGAELGFRDLLAHPERHAAGTPPPDMAPAAASFCRALATLAANMMEGAAVCAVRRDHAQAELLAGRAWAAPDGSIIGEPCHAA